MSRRTISGRTGFRRAATLLSAGLLSLGVVTSLTTAPAQAWDPVHTVMQGSPTTMGQTNGAVWTLEVAAGRIYAGGNFTSTRPSGAARGTGETGAANLAAFDATTGAPITSFAPQLTNSFNGNQGVVRTSVLTPDGSQLIVGGEFNRVDGQRADYIARFNARTGAFLGGVGQNGVDGPVGALAVSPDGSTLYVGGRFSRVGNAKRKNLGAISLVTNQTLPWAPTLASPTRNEALRVSALGVSSDNQRVFVAGPFQQVNGLAQQGFAATNASDGSLAAGFAGNYLTPPYSWGTAIEVAGNDVYVGSRDDFSPSADRTEGVNSINATTGARTWYANCYGDTFGVQVVGNDVYVASHNHNCGALGGQPELNPRTYLAIHALDRATGQLRPYFVQTDGTKQDQRSLLLSRALASDGNQLVMGGGFNSVNSSPQENLTRFLAGSSAPERAAYPTATAGPGYVDLRVRLGFDRDDVNLTYEVFRGWRTDVPLYTETRESVKWRTETFTWRDTGVTTGQKVYYRVRVSDPAGNQVMSVRTPDVTVG
ncbi:delta-60 repeat domain-containing protein [uncultured Nocardioides sp.]|uniref:delta-60 repeat domain-containing protein n=1 Tax=uncultured Nocardioides sp. TaxID=198441 RepID=UPI00345705E5